MTAFMVRESMPFTAEFGSKLYMCFLDIRQAFDRVWQDLLMVKLYRKDFNISLIKAIIDLYEDMFSCEFARCYIRLVPGKTVYATGRLPEPIIISRLWQ